MRRGPSNTRRPAPANTAEYLEVCTRLSLGGGMGPCHAHAECAEYAAPACRRPPHAARPNLGCNMFCCVATLHFVATNMLRYVACSAALQKWCTVQQHVFEPEPSRAVTVVPRSAVSDNGSSLRCTVLQHVVLRCNMLRWVAQHAVPGHAIRDAERSARTSQSSMRQPRVRRAVGLTVAAAVGGSAAGTRTSVTQTRTRDRSLHNGRAVCEANTAPTFAPGLAPAPCHICTGTGARPCHICTGTGFGQT